MEVLEAVRGPGAGDVHVVATEAELAPREVPVVVGALGGTAPLWGAPAGVGGTGLGPGLTGALTPAAGAPRSPPVPPSGRPSVPCPAWSGRVCATARTTGRGGPCDPDNGAV